MQGDNEMILDYTGRLTPAQLLGYEGVCRYLSFLPNHKVILKPEYDMLINGGKSVTLNWEFDARDWMGGAAAGKQHATEAIRQARDLGYPPGCVLIGSADFDMTRAQWNSVGLNYAIAYAIPIVASGFRAGVYGPWDVLDWCYQLGLFHTFWQASMSSAWSAGRNSNAYPHAQLRQLRRAVVHGVSVDVNTMIPGSNWGQSTGDNDMTPEQAKQLSAINFSETQVPMPDGTRAPQHVAIGELLKNMQSGGLTDADRQAIQELTVAVNNLNSRLASP